MEVSYCQKTACLYYKTMRDLHTEASTDRDVIRHLHLPQTFPKIIASAESQSQRQRELSSWQEYDADPFLAPNCSQNGQPVDYLVHAPQKYTQIWSMLLLKSREATVFCASFSQRKVQGAAISHLRWRIYFSMPRSLARKILPMRKVPELSWSLSPVLQHIALTEASQIFTISFSQVRSV